MLTDTHCHLDLEIFDVDRTDVIRRAQIAGVSRILMPGLTLESSRSVVKLACSHEILFAAIGVHPNDTDSWNSQTKSDLEQLALSLSDAIQNDNRKKVVAIGEIGLDYYWNSATRSVQMEILKGQLALARELHLPVVIHFREKDDNENGECSADLMNILEVWIAGLRANKDPLSDRPGVLHSFSGSPETAEHAIKLGFSIGVTGPVTFKKAENRRKLIAGLPLDKLLIETDAPFLSPEPNRGKRNEPAFVAYIADKIAEIKSYTSQEIAAATAKNAAKLFAWEETV